MTHDNGGPVDKNIKKIEDHTKDLNKQNRNKVTMLRAFRRQLQVLALLIVALLICPACKGQDVAFCSFPLSKGVLQAHATFNAVYEFDLDEHGTPIKITQVARAL